MAANNSEGKLNLICYSVSLSHSSRVNCKTFPKKKFTVQPQGSILFGLERDKRLDCHGIQTSIAPGRCFVSTQDLA